MFLAKDMRLARSVAIKFVRTDRAHQPEYQKRLLKEARCSATVTHENIAKILDVSPDGAPTPYIVFEFVEGVTVATLLEKRGRLPFDDAIDIVLDVCAGLSEAHRVGVIHRDLKPENLIVDEREDGRHNVKIVDFGVARAEATTGESQATATDSAGGTPHYMAPEVVRGESYGDARADVYAMGAILYELLSGEKPHPGSSRNAVLYHAATRPPRPIADWVAEIPADLAQVIDDALAANPKDRISDMKVLLDRLRDVRRTNSIAPLATPLAAPSSRSVLDLVAPLAVGLAAGALLGALGTTRWANRTQDLQLQVDTATLDEPQTVSTHAASPSVVPEPIESEQSWEQTNTPHLDSSLPTHGSSPASLPVSKESRPTNRAKTSSKPASRSPAPPQQPREIEATSPPLLGFETENPYE